MAHDEIGPHGHRQDAAASDDEHSFAPPNDINGGGSSTEGLEKTMDANNNSKSTTIPYLSKEELELVAKGKRPVEVSETVSVRNGENLASDNKDLRAHHILIERKRRDRMRDLYGELQALMPQVPDQKKTKVAIVDQAFNFIQSLEKTRDMLEKRKHEVALARQAASPLPAPPHIFPHSLHVVPPAAGFSSSAPPPQIAVTQGVVAKSSDIIPHGHGWPDVLLAGVTTSSSSVPPQIALAQEMVAMSLDIVPHGLPLAAGAVASSSSAPPQITLAQEMVAMSPDIVPHGCWPDVLLAAGAGAGAEPSSLVPRQIAIAQGMLAPAMSSDILPYGWHDAPLAPGAAASSSSVPPPVAHQGMAAMALEVVPHNLHELLPQPLGAALAMPAPQLLPMAMPSDVTPPPPPTLQPLAAPLQPLAVAVPVPPQLPVGFQTWSWPNLVLSVLHDNACITVLMPRHLRTQTMVMVLSMLDKYGIDVVIMLVSSDAICSMFSIMAHVAGTGAENPLAPEDLCKLAVSEMLVWLSGN